MHAVRPRPGPEATPYLVAVDGQRLAMSWQACKAIADLQIPSHPDAGKGGFSSPAVAKSVLWPIAEAARPDGSGVTISVNTIARRAQISRRAAISGLKLLEWAGIISKSARYRGEDGGRTSDEITLNPSLLIGIVPSAPPREGPARGTMQDMREGRALRAPQEPVLEPKGQRESAPPRLKISKGEPVSPTWEPPEDAYDFGASLGLTNQEVERETAKFRDWHLARQSTALSADWAATWRLWMRRASERKPPAPLSQAHDRRDHSSASGVGWGGPEEVRDLLQAAGLGGYLGYFTWRDVPDRALVIRSPTIHARLRPVERSLREAGWPLILERAA